MKIKLKNFRIRNNNYNYFFDEDLMEENIKIEIFKINFNDKI
jgi:hypothetical protein